MFRDLPLWINMAIFIASAMAIWFPGSQVTGYADAPIGRDALNSLQASPIVLLHAALGIILVALAIGAVVVLYTPG